MWRSIRRRRRLSLHAGRIARPIQPCTYAVTAPMSQQSPRLPATLEEFACLVAQALDSLPWEIIEKLENVAVTVEEQPSEEVLKEVGLTNAHELLGLYRGVPRPWRSMFATLSSFPDKIEIYYQPIIHACSHPNAVKDLIRRVVIHEVGHHFGMSDQQLKALGY
jgi:predicted Zn-dependent protease with MMP-like domain